MAMAVIDRFEGENAVLLVGQGERQAIFPASELPQGLQEGDYIRMDIAFDEETTNRAMDESMSLLGQLQGRQP